MAQNATRSRTTATLPAQTCSGSTPYSTPAPRIHVYMRSAVSGTPDLLEPQRGSIEAYLRSRGLISPDAVLGGEHAPADGVFVDLGCDGMSGFAGRSGGSELLQACGRTAQAGDGAAPRPVGTVVVDSWDRLGRSEGVLEVRSELEALGWSLHSVREGLDLAQDGLLDQLRDLLPRFERERMALLASRGCE